MPVPTVEDAITYVRSIDTMTAVDTAAIAQAYAAEKAAQARKCRVPADDADWPGDLALALCRRVAVTIARRGHAIGFVPSTDPNGGATYLPSTDSEVRRLEAPHRRLGPIG